MTIDEAIKVFEKIGSYDGLVDYLKDYSVSVQDACFMAIKALKQYGALQEIRQEIENNMETITGTYDASTPEYNMPSHKIERNFGRKECIAIIDKHIKEIEK